MSEVEDNAVISDLDVQRRDMQWVDEDWWKLYKHSTLISAPKY